MSLACAALSHPLYNVFKQISSYTSIRRGTLPKLIFLLFIALTSFPVYADRFTTMYVFGDSLSDTGNLYQLTSDHPFPDSGAEPIPSASYYDDGRFQNGPAYAELLWKKLGFPYARGNDRGKGKALGLGNGLRPVTRGGTNYAIGGARGSYHQFDVEFNGDQPPLPGEQSLFYDYSLLGQIEAFKAMHKVPQKNARALYIVWSGGNDLADILGVFLANSAASATGLDATSLALLENSIGNTVSALQSLVEAGAKTIVVPDVPNVVLTPRFQGVLAQVRAVSGNAAAAQLESTLTGIASAYNNLLRANLGLLASTAAEVDIIPLAVNQAFEAVVKNPKQYGFYYPEPCLTGFFVAPSPATGDDATAELCNSSTEDQRIFWDIFHPSARLHKIIAEIMAVSIARYNDD